MGQGRGPRCRKRIMNKSERIIVVDRGVPDAPDGPCHKFNHAIYSTAPERPRPFPTEHFIMFCNSKMGRRAGCPHPAREKPCYCCKRCKQSIGTDARHQPAKGNAITGQVLAPAGCCAMIPHIGLYPGISPHHMPHTRVRTMCAPTVSIGIKRNFPPPTAS